MKKTYKILVPAFIFLISLAIALTLTKQLGRLIPDIIEYKALQGAEDIIYAEKVLDDGECAVSKSLSSVTVSNFKGSINMQALYTTSGYGNILKIKMLYGKYLNNDDVMHSKSCAVIPQSLAFKMFLTDNVCGLDMLIENEYYTVAGVYDDSLFYVQKMCAPFESIIYTSKAIEGVEYTSVSYISSLNGKHNKISLEKKLKDHLKTNTEFEMNNIYLLKKVSTGICNFVIFVFVAVPLLLVFFANSYKRLVSLYSNEYNYSGTMAVKIIYAIIHLFICIAFLKILLSIVSLPNEILPNENIFDLSHYVSLVMDFYRALFYSKSKNIYQVYSAVYSPLIMVFSIICALEFWKIIHKIKELFF